VLLEYLTHYVKGFLSQLCAHHRFPLFL